MGTMSDRAAKDALFDGFAEVAKALASGRRAEIVDLLAQGERSVDEISDEIGQSVANTSHHLRAMARANTNPKAQFFPVRGATHFSILAPATRLIADKILRDDGATSNLSFTEEELNALFRK